MIDLTIYKAEVISLSIEQEQIASIKAILIEEENLVFLEDLIVREPHRGNGYSSYLLDICIDRYIEEGRDIRLIAKAYNEGPLNDHQLITWYTSKGFICSGQACLFSNKEV
jgi:GNAT superfamily N-acetyltransferase